MAANLKVGERVTFISKDRVLVWGTVSLIQVTDYYDRGGVEEACVTCDIGGEKWIATSKLRRVSTGAHKKPKPVHNLCTAEMMITNKGLPYPHLYVLVDKRGQILDDQSWSLYGFTGVFPGTLWRDCASARCTLSRLKNKMTNAVWNTWKFRVVCYVRQRKNDNG